MSGINSNISAFFVEDPESTSVSSFDRLHLYLVDSDKLVECYKTMMGVDIDDVDILILSITEEDNLKFDVRSDWFALSFSRKTKTIVLSSLPADVERSIGDLYNESIDAGFDPEVVNNLIYSTENPQRLDLRDLVESKLSCGYKNATDIAWQLENLIINLYTN